MTRYTVLVLFLILVCLPTLIVEAIDSLPVVRCTTTKGDMDIELYLDWSPLGAKRFVELVVDGFFTDIGLFRCVKRFLTQFGISDKPKYQHWHNDNIPDDPNLHLGIKKYYLSFAGGGPNTRSTQLFIAFEDLDFLGESPWETPFGKVIRGMDVVDSWYTGYGDMKGFTETGVDQQLVYRQGNKYLKANFPKLDYILSCHIMKLPQQPLREDESGENEEKNNKAQNQELRQQRQPEDEKDNAAAVETDTDTKEGMFQALDKIAAEAVDADANTDVMIVDHTATQQQQGNEKIIEKEEIEDIENTNKELLHKQQQQQLLHKQKEQQLLHQQQEQQEEELIDKEKLLLHEGLDNLLHQVEPLFSHRGKLLSPHPPHPSAVVMKDQPQQKEEEEDREPKEAETKYSLRSSSSGSRSSDKNNNNDSRSNQLRQFLTALLSNSLFRYAALILLCGSVFVSVYLYRQSEKITMSKHN